MKHILLSAVIALNVINVDAQDNTKAKKVPFDGMDLMWINEQM